MRASIVAVEMLAIALVSLLVAWRRGTLPADRRWWLPLALIPAAVLLLLLPVSRPIWNTLPELRPLLFLWRWLLALEAPMSVCFACAAWPRGRRVSAALITGYATAFLPISFAAELLWSPPTGSVAAIAQQAMQAGVGVMGFPEYVPPGVAVARVDKVFPDACLLSAETAAGAPLSWDGKSNSFDPGFRDTVFLPEQKRIEVECPTDAR